MAGRDLPTASGNGLPGTELQSGDRTELRAGAWRLIYTAGELRYVCYGGREVVRRIYVTVRDRYWNAVPARIASLRVVQRDVGFEASFTARNLSDQVDVAWRCLISGDADGVVTYRVTGKILRALWRNRMGICVLHPHSLCAGQRCRITHEDGAIEESRFPDEIAPHQPFLDIRALAYEVGPGAWVGIRLAGEVFEMEDQRNWIDGSFKTYCTPLARPRPVWVEAGTVVEQSVTLRVTGPLPAEPADAQGSEVVLDVSEAAPRELPRLGLALSGTPANLDPDVIQHLRRLRLAHLRGDLAVGEPGWEAEAQRLAAAASALNAPAAVALFLPGDWQSHREQLAATLRRLPEVWAWLVFARDSLVTPPELARSLRPVLSDIAPRALLGGGSNGYFAHLNRARPPAGLFDLLVYPATPQVHAEDEDTMVEALSAAAATVRTASSFAHGVRIAVSPITLKPRSSPAALAAGAPPAPPPADPRQASLFAAAWTAISFKYLAESGADAVTYFETVGERGVLAVDGASLTTFPIYNVLAEIGEFAGGGVIPCTSNRPLSLDTLLLASGTRRRLFIANFAADPTTLVIPLSAIPDGVELNLHRFSGGSEGHLPLPESTAAAQVPAPSWSASGLRIRALPNELARIDWDLAG